MWRAVAFGPFQFDWHSRELRKGGIPIKLRPQSVEVLATLLERPGEVIPREDLRARLWTGLDYGDQDAGLNSAVNRLRGALGDCAGAPRYIETIARRGYRFVRDVNPTVSEKRQAIRLVVLPFTNLSGDPADEYFCGGLAEELTHALTCIQGLHVIARTTALALKGRNMDVGEIGRMLGVSAVVEGAVQKSVDRLRITVQLVNAVDGCHVWSGRFDRVIGHVFDIQDETASAVVGALLPTLLEGEEARLLKRHTENTAAYDSYLKGRWMWSKRAPGAVTKAIGCFEDALALDPRHALTHAALSECYCTSGFLAYMAPRVAFLKAKEWAIRALDLDPGLGPAEAALGWALWAYDWDFPEAERRFLRAEQLSPSYPQARLWHSFLLASLSRFDEALEQIEGGWQLDPLSSVMESNVGAILHLARRHREAAERCLRVLERDPDSVLGNFHLGRAYLAMQNYDGAVPVLEKAAPEFPLAMGALGSAWARSGQRDKAREIARELNRLSETRYVGHVPLFGVRLALGEVDAAVSELKMAFDAREGVVPILAVDPSVDPVRGDPRVKALMRRLKVRRKKGDASFRPIRRS